MGTYRKMKQAERVIHILENDLEHYPNVSEKIEKATLDRLKSTRDKYRSLKYQYNVQATALIMTIVLLILGIVASILSSGL